MSAAGPPAEILRGGSAPPVAPSCELRVVCWNIERGERLAKVAAALERLAPTLALLQEVDWNARRSGRAAVAEVLAERLKLNYLFAAEFEELGQGSRSRPAYHGQAVLTAWPVAEARILHFEVQSGRWEPRWYLPNWAVFQRRLGGRLALAVELGDAARRLAVYDVHLESGGPEELRRTQIAQVIADARRYSEDTPVLVAGDFNTRAGELSVTAALRQAGFHKALGGEVTTTRGAALDWIFVRGQVAFSEGSIHTNVRASDHFPLSLRLRLQGSGCRQ